LEIASSFVFPSKPDRDTKEAIRHMPDKTENFFREKFTATNLMRDQSRQENTIPGTELSRIAIY
jgi:hypothetical protein